MGSTTKRCTTCGASYPEGDEYCEIDGSRLGNEAAPGEAGVCCPWCEATLLARDVECLLCGRTSPEPRPGAGPVIEFAGMRVLKQVGSEGLLVCTEGGALRHVLFGSERALRHEQEALAAAAGRPGVPGCHGLLEAPGRGAYLLLDGPPRGAERGNGVVGWLSLREMSAGLRAALDVHECLAEQGLRWEPLPDDFRWSPGGDLCLMRLRGSARLAKGASADARSIFYVLGASLAPWPASLASTTLMRGLVPSRGGVNEQAQQASALRGWLGEALAEPEPTEERLAERSDPGLWRPYNQDATGVAAGKRGEVPWVVLVVCDGVSSSSGSARAAQIAAETTRQSLERSMAEGASDLEEAMREAIQAAHEAICKDATEPSQGLPPGTTLVAAVVLGKAVTLGWIGDSRAYWATPHKAELLTRDHSWINEVVARGEMTEEQAMNSPNAHTITRCLGPLEGAPEDLGPADTASYTIKEPGVLVLCTDGLWNYTQDAGTLAEVIRAAGDNAGAGLIARTLVNFALACGGQDNVSVAVYRVGATA